MKGRGTMGGMFKKATMASDSNLETHMSDLLSHEDPNERKKAAENLQKARLDLQEEADSYNNMYKDYMAQVDNFERQFSAKSLENLGLPPAAHLAMPAPLPKPARESQPPEPTFLAKLQGGGFDIIKHGRKGKPHPRRLWLTSDGEKLCCSNDSGMGKAAVTLLEAVQGEVLKGWQTEVFERSKQFAVTEDACFSIKCESRTLDIECKNHLERDELVDSFNQLFEAMLA
jgi:hypothetical protein